MSYRTIRDALAAILLTEEENILPETPFWGAVDAVSVAKLILFCEERYRITIRDERVHTFLHFIDLVREVAALAQDGCDDYQQPTVNGREGWYYD